MACNVCEGVSVCVCVCVCVCACARAHACVCVHFPGERPEAFIRFSKRSVVPKGLRNTDALSTEAENCSGEAWLESCLSKDRALSWR